jgi:selenocysteine-specific elongation factor
VAVNLAGCDRAELERGEWLLTPDALAPSTLLDVQLELAPDAAPLAHRTRIRLHHGTAERIGRVVLLDRAELAPGESAPAQLVLERPVVAAYGDRFVLRRYAPMAFLGGGKVLHATPAKHKRHHPGALAALEALGAGDPLAAMAEALKTAQRTPVALETLLGYVPADRHDEARAWLASHARAMDGGRFMGAEAATALAAELAGSIAQFHAAVPWRLGLTKEAIAQRTKLPLPIAARMLEAMHRDGALTAIGRLYADPGHHPVDPPEVARLRSGIRGVLAAQPLADAEDFAGLGGGDRLAPLLDDMIESGELARLAGGIYAAVTRLEAIREGLRAHFQTASELTASQARVVVGSSRKYVIPLLEHLDAEGFTRRRGDVRTLAPKREG